jgi:hypothetical protein
MDAVRLICLAAVIGGVLLIAGTFLAWYTPHGAHSSMIGWDFSFRTGIYKYTYVPPLVVSSGVIAILTNLLLFFIEKKKMVTVLIDVSLIFLMIITFISQMLFVNQTLGGGYSLIWHLYDAGNVEFGFWITVVGSLVVMISSCFSLLNPKNYE